MGSIIILVHYFSSSIDEYILSIDFKFLINISCFLWDNFFMSTNGFNNDLSSLFFFFNSIEFEIFKTLANLKVMSRSSERGAVIF